MADVPLFLLLSHLGEGYLLFVLFLLEQELLHHSLQLFDSILLMLFIVLELFDLLFEG